MSTLFLIKDHAHIMDIAYKPFYNEANLFGPLVHVVKIIFRCCKNNLSFIMVFFR